MLNEVKERRYDFLQRAVLGTTTPINGWLQEKTGSPPDIETYDGALKIALNATSQAQANRACFGNDLPFRIADIKEIRFVVAADDFGALVEAAFGICDAAPADDPDSTAVALMWRVDADNAVTVDADDGTNDVSVDAGQTLSTTFKEFVLDLHSGVLQKDPRSGGSVGARACILPSMTDSNGHLAQVARSSVISMEDTTARVQLFMQISKASGTGAGAIYVREIEVVLKDLSYAMVTTTTTTTTTTT